MKNLLTLFFKWQVFFCFTVHAVEISSPSIEDVILNIENQNIEEIENTPPIPTYLNNSLEKYICTKTNHSNFRKGPGTKFPIEHKIMVPNYPLLVLKEADSWFGVQDFEGTVAWVSQINIKNSCGAIVKTPSVTFAYFHPSKEAKIVFSLQKGYIIPELQCTLDWCKANIKNKTVWIQRTNLWGKLD